jgi:Holliday junction resolvasome RuvABC ATP-dependent DNA helicase subunit
MSNSPLDNTNNEINSIDKEFENSIRPREMEAFAGQPQLIENISIFIKAAKMRGEPLDHILFHGPKLILHFLIFFIIAWKTNNSLTKFWADPIMSKKCPNSPSANVSH